MTEVPHAFPPLPSDFVQELRAVPSAGERLRRIRRFRGFTTQSAFLEAMANSFGGDAPTSRGWLSGIESGSLELADKRARQMARVLQLSEDEQVLISSDADLVPASDSMNRYAAWQAVRLALADEMLRGRDRDERVRGENARDRLHDALEANDEIRRAANKRIDRVDQFTDSLPEAARWMLLVEAAFMDPFFPLSPFKFEFDRSRTEILGEIAGQLALAAPQTVIKSHIEGSRRPPRANVPSVVTFAKDVEPKSYERDPGGISRAAVSAADPGGDYALLCGGALVGALGWDFAAGAFLVAHPLEYRGSGAGEAEVWSELPRAAVPMRTVVTPAQGRGFGKAAAVEAGESGLNAPEFLVGLGKRAFNNELAKLKAVTLIRDEFQNLGDGFAGEGIPPAGTVAARLTDLRRGIEGAIEARKGFDRAESEDIKAMKMMVRALDQYGRTAFY